MNSFKATCLASVLLLGAAATPAIAQSFEFGPGGVRVDPDSREYRGERRGGLEREDAVRAARRAGMDDIERTSRRGGDWIVEGTDRRGRDVRMRVDGRDGDVSVSR
jgi:hypothetical protein